MATTTPNKHKSPKTGPGRAFVLAALILGFALPLGFSAEAHADDRPRRAKPTEVRKRSIDKREAIARRQKPVKKTVVKRTTVKKTTVRTRRVRTRRTHMRRSSHHHSSTVVVHSGGAYHRSPYDHSEDPEIVVTRPRRRGGPYIGMGLGLVGIDNDRGNLGGSALSLSMGMRQDNMSLEFGFLAAAQAVDSQDELVQDLTLGGVSADLKLFLPIGSDAIEPYGQLGFGYYTLSTAEEQSDMHPALNFGGGVDVRLTRSLAIGGRYLYHGFFFEAPESRFGETTDSQTAMGTLTVYF